MRPGTRYRARSLGEYPRVHASFSSMIYTVRLHKHTLSAFEYRPKDVIMQPFKGGCIISPSIDMFGSRTRNQVFIYQIARAHAKRVHAHVIGGKGTSADTINVKRVINPRISNI